MRKIKPWLMLAMLVLGTAGLSACNTMQGAGQDIQRAGEGLEQAAD